MSIIKKENGKFICVDTVNLNPELKAEIDSLTSNGSLIEAVIATHPYHTLAFPDFYLNYPNAKYFGTPRHLKIFDNTVIPWDSELLCENSLRQFEPDLYLRIPDGAEFVNPLPPTTNHFSNIFVFHAKSKTLHNNDTIMVFENPGFLLSFFAKHGDVKFHRSITGPGLYPTKEAPFQFKNWLEKLILDWDFDNICSAHNGNLIGGAKVALKNTLEKFTPTLQKISDTNAAGGVVTNEGAWTDKPNHPTECG
ncbi:hypothetical protein HK099_007253 [Clydaea vesicula]|uniref:Uncharacterized protein n=1 Tax=Clydaea vesicula TaxID=447962 RepID=A0AAD5U6S7_9FUNG|nr:hypothetical protein HK099_007253 [Clydaea vesicula]